MDFRECAEQLVILLRSNIPVDFIAAVAFEVFGQEAAVIHLEIITDKLQRFIIVFDHQMRVLTDDVDLLDSLLVKCIQLSVVFPLILDMIIHLQSVELHGVVGYEKAAIQKDQKIAGSTLAQSMIQEIEAARMLSVVDAGKKGKSRLERLQEELRDPSNRALDIEIETTEKYAARVELMEQDPNALLEFERQIGDVMGADDEHLFWTFDGEYWRDELGYYWYYIFSRCGR